MFFKITPLFFALALAPFSTLACEKHKSQDQAASKSQTTSQTEGVTTSK